MKNRSLILLLVAIITISSVQIIGAESDADSVNDLEGDFLLDYGNGRTMWIKSSNGETIGDVIKSALTSAKIDYTEDLTSVDGIENCTVGSTVSDGSLSIPGTTGVISNCDWSAYKWEDSEWKMADPTATYDGSNLALAYYPEGIIPVNTPYNKSSWTAIQGNSWNSANQTTTLSDQTGEVWSIVPKYGPESSGLYGGILTARDYVILKYGNSSGVTGNASVKCFDMNTHEEIWSFDYRPAQLDTTSALIVGQNIYVGSNNGHIYKFDWRVGPGEDNSNVTTLFGKAWDDPEAIIPTTTIDIDWYVSWTSLITSMVADSGAIYTKAYNGMTYCFDLDLNLLWSAQMEGHCYYSTPTVFDGYTFSGCYDGTLYVFNQYTGELVGKQVIYQTVDFKGKCGAANTPQVFKNEDGTYTVFVTCSDGLGMDSKYSALTIFKFDGSSFTLVKDFKNTMGSTGAFLTRYVTENFEGVIAAFDSGLYTVDKTGNIALLSDFPSGFNLMHNTPLLVNGNLLYLNTYNSKKTVSIEIDTGRIGLMSGLSSNSMASPVVVDGYVFCPDDTGMHVYYSYYEKYTPVDPVPTDEGVWKIIAYVLVALIVILAVIWVVLRFVMKWEHPFADLKAHVLHFFFGSEYTHNKRSKRKVRAVFLIGLAMTLIVSLISLCVGPETTLGLGDAITSAISAIQKGGHNLSYEEMLIYNQRLPR
ncbi:MAG: PQQ-binding-like beta-propeller repeat protein, partial [Paludibacteraceae bacterium]|nr:PQQ-binding-like beta-propeller repeat protein [Paludibacteraceae bacterium]